MLSGNVPGDGFGTNEFMGFNAYAGKIVIVPR
jgi:hypothetical protein